MSRSIVACSTTNGVRSAEDIHIPIGTLRFTDGHGDVQPVAIEAVDRLERYNSDGSKSIHVATGGDELIDDIADVVAFGLDVVMLPERSLAEQVVSGAAAGMRSRGKLLRQVLEPRRYVTDDEIADLRTLCGKMLAMRRPFFDAAMRAIRRFADAITFAHSDVSLSYMLFVAALESLSKGATAYPSSWSDYDPGKRRLVDEALEGLTIDQADRVRHAVIRIDMLSIRRRFQGFVMEHVTEDYYRGEAKHSSDPVRAVELPKALDFAYQLRSTTVHELRDLAPELRDIAQDRDTLWHQGQKVLTLEGLRRLCRHVIRQYMERAPSGIDPEFRANYRRVLPGIARVRLVAEIWLPKYAEFRADDGPRVFSGAVECFFAALTGDASGVPDLFAPLERIEALLWGESVPEKRLPLVAAYSLWHGLMGEEHSRPRADAVLRRHGELLGEPSMYSYALMLFGLEVDFSDEQLVKLATDRDGELRRQSKTLLELPSRLDATLRLHTAQRAWGRGDWVMFLEELSRAVELLPGDEQLVEIEQQARRSGCFPDLDVRDFFAKRLSAD